MNIAEATLAQGSIVERVAMLDWPSQLVQLDTVGFATTGPLLSATECAELRATYHQSTLFRSRIDMARHSYGRGEYQYFAYPLPNLITSLRTTLYAHLVAAANTWQARMGSEHLFPGDHPTFLERCHNAGQARPTPLILRYGPGDYNCLHQDLYGEHVFPVQVAILLSTPGIDFTGGEFILTEQRPRMQSRASVVPLMQGEGVIFAVNQRPVRGTRGDYRVTMRHGVSSLRSGERFTLGVIFHDAK
jgi:uncharacterized protein